MTKIELEKELIIEQFDKLNLLVTSYYEKYNDKPKMIIMSELLHYGLSLVLEEQLTSMVNGNKIDFLLGIPVIDSPILQDLEFKVY